MTCHGIRVAGWRDEPNRPSVLKGAEWFDVSITAEDDLLEHGLGHAVFDAAAGFGVELLTDNGFDVDDED